MLLRPVVSTSSPRAASRGRRRVVLLAWSCGFNRLHCFLFLDDHLLPQQHRLLQQPLSTDDDLLLDHCGSAVDAKPLLIRSRSHESERMKLIRPGVALGAWERLDLAHLAAVEGDIVDAGPPENFRFFQTCQGRITSNCGLQWSSRAAFVGREGVGH